MPETGARGEAPYRGLLIDGTPEDEALLARLTGGALHVVTCSSATLDRETAAGCDIAIIGRAARADGIATLLEHLPAESRGPPVIVRIDDPAAVAAALVGALAKAAQRLPR